MVVHHWSDDGMVRYHRTSLQLSVKDADHQKRLINDIFMIVQGAVICRRYSGMYTKVLIDDTMIFC